MTVEQSDKFNMVVTDQVDRLREVIALYEDHMENPENTPQQTASIRRAIQLHKEAVTIIQSAVTRHSLQGIWRNWWYPGRMTRDEAVAVQLKLGYHPAGYSFCSFESKDGETKWQCYHSCD